MSASNALFFSRSLLAFIFLYLLSIRLALTERNRLLCNAVETFRYSTIFQSFFLLLFLLLLLLLLLFEMTHWANKVRKWEQNDNNKIMFGHCYQLSNLCSVSSTQHNNNEKRGTVEYQSTFDNPCPSLLTISSIFIVLIPVLVFVLAQNNLISFYSLWFFSSSFPSCFTLLPFIFCFFAFCFFRFGLWNEQSRFRREIKESKNTKKQNLEILNNNVIYYTLYYTISCK